MFKNKNEENSFFNEIAVASNAYVVNLVRLADKYNEDRNKVIFCAATSVVESCSIFDFTNMQVGEEENVDGGKDG